MLVNTSSFLEKYPHQFAYFTNDYRLMEITKIEFDDYYIIYNRLNYQKYTGKTCFEYIVHASSIEVETLFRLKYG